MRIQDAQVAASATDRSAEAGSAVEFTAVYRVVGCKLLTAELYDDGLVHERLGTSPVSLWHDTKEEAWSEWAAHCHQRAAALAEESKAWRRAAVEAESTLGELKEPNRCRAAMVKGRCELDTGHDGCHRTRNGEYAWGFSRQSDERNGGDAATPRLDPREGLEVHGG
jgi:hypothetical protein